MDNRRWLKIDSEAEWKDVTPSPFCLFKPKRGDYFILFQTHFGGNYPQNAFIERFNQTVRTEVLNAYMFSTLSEVRVHINEFILDYNHHRSHDSLGNMTPIQLHLKHESSTLQLSEN